LRLQRRRQPDAASPQRRPFRVLIWIVGVPLVSYLAMLSYLFLFQRRLLYFPDRSHPFLAGLPQLGVREVTLQTADGLALSAWFLPPPDGRPAVAYFHGNGSPSEAGFNADAVAALEFLRRQGIAGDRLVLYGESLGSAVAIRLAATQQIAALILESPFTSIAALAQYHYPLVPAALLVWDRFDALARIGEVTAPILFLQGGRDRIVPPRFGQELFDAAPDPKQHWFAADGGHQDLARFGALEAAVAFIEQHVP
jgi:hypothetical protein